MTQKQPRVLNPGTEYLGLAERAVEKARQAGAQNAEAYLEAGRTFEVTLRNGEIEVLKQAHSKGVGLRVIHEQRLGFVYSNDLSETSLEEIAKKAMALAKHAAQDEFLGLPEGDVMATSGRDPNLELVDTDLGTLSTDRKIATAREMEGAALSLDPRVKMVEGSSVADGDEWVVLANSKGFSGAYRSTGTNLSCSVVAQENGQKQVNYWFSNKRHLRDHEPAEGIGRKAAQRAVQMLNARKIPSGKYPVVFDPLSASSLIRALAGALNGESVYRNTSFLTDRLNERIGPDFFTLTDDAVMLRGNASRPFDAEGVSSSRSPLVDRGVLKSFLYDSYTARKAGKGSTGNASRNYASTPHITPTNLYVDAGQSDADAIIRSVQEGFLVTGMIGFGVDLVSGQFSRGANGVWIERGELAYPVHEVTIAGSLAEMIANIEMIGNDLVFLDSISSPTLKISEMTISGR